MDPVSIVGVAAAAVQFLSFTTSVATGGWRALSSYKSLPIKANELRDAAKRFGDTILALKEHLERLDLEDRNPSSSELKLRELCKSCQDRAQELYNAISGLAEKLGSGELRKSLWEALKTEMGFDEIKSLSETLATYQQSLITVIVTCI